MSEDDLQLYRIRRGGARIFFDNIKRGCKNFLQYKKGGRKKGGGVQTFIGEKVRIYLTHKYASAAK